MNSDPDYSAAYCALETDQPDGLAGHRLTFTIGRGKFFARLTRFRWLVKEYECLPETVAGLHLVAFSTVMLGWMVTLLLAART
jgi:hypothetical protein